MSGFDSDFTPSGSGHNRGTVPDPGGTAGTRRYLCEDATWAIPPTQPPVPPPPSPGPAFNQWACNIAGYLTYDVARFAVKFALDATPTTWLGDVVGGVVAGIFRAVLAEDPIIAAIVEDAVFNWVSAHIVGLASAAITDLLDDVLWKKIHCLVYSAVLATPTNLASILTAAAGAISLLAGYNAAALACLNYFFANLGLTDIFGIPVGALAPNYDCSTCSVSGIGPTVPLQQKSFDLVVTDGTVTGTFIDTVKFTNATVAVTGTEADVTIPPALSVTDGTTTVTAVDAITLDHSTVSGSGGSATITPGIDFAHNDVSAGAEAQADFEDSSTITWTVTDDPTNHRSKVSAATTSAAGFSNPMTAAADLIVGGTAGAPTRLGKGADGQVLTVDPTTHLLVWATPAASGMSNPMTSPDDLIVGGTAGAPTRLAAGSPGQFVGYDPVSGHVSAQALSEGSGISITQSAGQTFIATSATGAGGTACTRLGKVVVPVAVSAIDFTSIASGYSMLMLSLQARSDYTGASDDNLFMRMNGDTGNNYNFSISYTSGSGPSYAAGGPASALQLLAVPSEGPSSTPHTTNNMVIWIANYDTTAFYKTISGTCFEQDQASTFRAFTSTFGGSWSSLSAINHIEVFLQNGNFEVGSICTLWGFL